MVRLPPIGYMSWAESYRSTKKDPPSQHELGYKLDDGKPRLDMVLGGFANALLAVGEVGTFGAKKYTDKGWLYVPKGRERYSDAFLRHYIHEAIGETKDKESGYLHAAHTAWNALARLELMIREGGANTKIVE